MPSLFTDISGGETNWKLDLGMGVAAQAEFQSLFESFSLYVQFDFLAWGQHQMPHRRRMLKQTRCSARSCVVMGSVCCGPRERLEEERQECERRQERPARPDILPTKEEAMAQLRADRPKPKTMEEAMAEALEITRLLQAMQGNTAQEEEPAGLYEVGDIVLMGAGEYRTNYAVVTQARALPGSLLQLTSRSGLECAGARKAPHRHGSQGGPAYGGRPVLALQVRRDVGVQGWAAWEKGCDLAVELWEVAQLHQSSAADWGKSGGESGGRADFRCFMVLG